MIEPVTIMVSMHGDDVVLQIAGACVQLLESPNAGTSFRALTAAERAQIAAYLHMRYVTGTQVQA